MEANEQQHEKEIRQLEEEIALIQHEVWLWPNYSQQNPAYQRILAREQAALDALKKGMK